MLLSALDVEPAVRERSTAPHEKHHFTDQPVDGVFLSTAAESDPRRTANEPTLFSFLVRHRESGETNWFHAASSALCQVHNWIFDACKSRSVLQELACSICAVHGALESLSTNGLSDLIVNVREYLHSWLRYFHNEFRVMEAELSEGVFPNNSRPASEITTQALATAGALC